MAEGTYEYECERAELLGVNPPNRAQWEESERVRKENELAEQMTEIDIQDENINEGTSKMEEITNILSMTQMRLNKFKTVCGSLTSLIKIKSGIGHGGDGSEVDQSGGEQSSTSNADDSANVGAGFGAAPTANQDMQRKMSSGLDSFNSLLAKTENAHGSSIKANETFSEINY